MGKGFLRRSWDRYAKLGKGVKKNQKWRKPTGRDNKMREKRKGFPKVVSVGYKNDKKLSGKIEEKKPVMVYNIVDLEKIGKNEIAVIANIGKKKKLEIAKYAKEKNIELSNLNIKKIIKKSEKKSKKLDSKKSEVKEKK